MNTAVILQAIFKLKALDVSSELSTNIYITKIIANIRPGGIMKCGNITEATEVQENAFIIGIVILSPD